MKYAYTEKEFKKLGLFALESFGEQIGSGGSTVFGRGYARFMVRMENGDYVISSMH